MLELAVAESDWIAVDAWEATLPCFVDFGSVVMEIVRLLLGNIIIYSRNIYYIRENIV